MVDGRIRQCPADGTRAPDIERSAIVQVIIICGNEQCSIRSCRIGERIKQVSGAEMFARPSCVPGHTCQVGHQQDRFPGPDAQAYRPGADIVRAGVQCLRICNSSGA